MTLSPTWMVFLLGLMTALSTGLGAIPFWFIKDIHSRFVAQANALAAGLMLGASFGLMLEGSSYGAFQTLIGGAAGVLYILLSEHLIGEHEAMAFETIEGKSAKQMILFLGIMTVHSFAEGIAVGVSFGGGKELATLITIAIAVHNIPEGLAISAIMRPKGVAVWKCSAWSIFSSLPQPLMAVPAFLFVEAFRPILPYGIGFAAGAMVFMVFMELLPEAFQEEKKYIVGLWVSFAFTLMVLFQQTI